MDEGRVTQIAAAHIGEGYRIIHPDGTATAPVMAVDWHPGRAVLVLDDGDELDLPSDTMLSAIWHEDATDVPLTRPRVVDEDADPGVALMRAISDEYAGDPDIERLTARVARGFTTPSGLEGVARLAADLYLRLDDFRNALAVCALIIGEQFRDDYDRWTWVGRAIGLAHHLALGAGDTALATGCRNRLAAHPPYSQRKLDALPLYTDKITRAVARGDRDSEIAWRSTEVTGLMVVRGTGRSRTLSDERLEQMIHEGIEELRRAVGPT
jgi:hypothetical protein